MGSISRMNRCNRFIEEFNEDAKRLWKIDEPCIKSQSLGMQDGVDQVRMFITIESTDGEEHEFIMASPLFYDPMEPQIDVIGRMEEVWNMPREEAIRRLRKAELIDEDVT